LPTLHTTLLRLAPRLQRQLQLAFRMLLLPCQALLKLLKQEVLEVPMGVIPAYAVLLMTTCRIARAR